MTIELKNCIKNLYEQQIVLMINLGLGNNIEDFKKA